ncbi:MAG: hypothetical protein NXI32_22175 [bacterium]|nr:hypothetical protein [bacterium]
MSVKFRVMQMTTLQMLNRRDELPDCEERKYINYLTRNMTDRDYRECGYVKGIESASPKENRPADTFGGNPSRS